MRGRSAFSRRTVSSTSPDTTSTPPQSTSANNGVARRERIWKRAYEAKSRSQLRDLYRDWATTYDEDHEAIGFFGHVRAAEIVEKFVPFKDVSPVLDAGAGTGAAGVELAKRGFGHLTAVDLSDAMLEQAAAKGVYQHVVQADLGFPLDAFPNSHFAAAVLVGVFSFGQAPAHTLDEITRVVKPGGVVVFTMRTDFFESDAMGVRSRMEALEKDGVWQQVHLTEPEQYLPKKDPKAMFRVWCYRVQDAQLSETESEFESAVRRAMASPSRVKRLDHCHIWNSMGSRLYDRYIDCPDYYLVDAEEEILRSRAGEIVDGERLFVELGCGSARKVKLLFDAALRGRASTRLTYTPIDLSKGALSATKAEIEESYPGRVTVEPRHGHFDEVLESIPDAAGKVILFFGGSLGNIETLADTVEFLRSMRERMTVHDRFLIGIDLHKDEEILRRAYEAGHANHAFFMNMLRRINNELDANFDLTAFEQESTYDRDEPYEGIENRCVNMKLATTVPQAVYIGKLDMEVRLAAGDAVQVGTSRKFRREDIPKLLSLSGLQLRRQWLDSRGYFSVNECVRKDAPE